MQPVRQIIDDAPDMIPIPFELRHKRLELIMWPLDEPKTTGFDSRSPVTFKTMHVDEIIMPSREKRYER